MKKEIFIKPHNLTYSNLKAFFTTKSLNGSLRDLAGFKALPKFSNRVYLPIQKHTDKVMVLENDFKPVVADAVITRKKGVLIGIHVADCVPILLYDKKKSLIGAVHAGWRGTAAQILKNTIKAMQKRFHSSAEDVLIAIGPSIRQCCYEVGEEVKHAVYNVTGEGSYYRRQNGKYFIDLSSANMIQALSMGIQEENIYQSDECTFCNPDRFYSYRYTKGSAGRQGGFIGMW
ncbi:MAG: peptidoglycan editing factor PgeF [Nitrospirae bacterium]|nr:peptidoglycan editing factor PgeF [Nitrospirota bacterium]